MTNEVKYGYYYIGSSGKIFRAVWTDSFLDKKRLVAGNHFTNRKEAEKARGKVSVALGGNKGVLGMYKPKHSEVCAITVTRENIDMVAELCGSRGTVDKMSNSAGQRWLEVDGYVIDEGNIVAFDTGTFQTFETFEDAEQFERLYAKV